VLQISDKSMSKASESLKVSRKIHKWLMLFIGVQVVLWSLTGTYMVFFDIDYIHGDSLVVNHQEKINPNNLTYSLQEVLGQYPGAENISVGKFIDKAVYRFSAGGATIMLDAQSGARISPLDKLSAERAARYYYRGEGEVGSIELISEDPPFELNSRALPAWRVNFADFSAPAIYVSAQSGLLVGKRHQFWRLFDWMFRFHVMDYGDEEAVDNLLLFCISAVALIASLFGLILVYFKVFKGKLSAQTRPLTARPYKPRFKAKRAMWWVRKLHKWASVLVGLQLVLWLCSGLYFNLMDHTKAAGQLYRNHQPPGLVIDTSQLVEPGQVLATFAPSVSLSTITLLDQPYYLLTHIQGLYKHFVNDYTLVNAYTGSQVIIDKEMAQDLAKNSYSGPGELTLARLVYPPIDDFPAFKNPVWQLHFADEINTRVYLETTSGRIVGHSDEHKRLADIFFMLHFMDYTNAGSFNSIQMMFFAFITLWLSLSGLIWSVNLGLSGQYRVKFLAKQR
jgi:hypothetical protein